MPTGVTYYNRYNSRITFDEVTVTNITNNTGGSGTSLNDVSGEDFLWTGIEAASTVVDEFAIEDAEGAEWTIISSGPLGRRKEEITATWDDDGTNLKQGNHSGTIQSGDTSGISYAVSYNGGVIQLTATRTAGTWRIAGKRWFTPSNGTSTGPASDSLPNAHIWVGTSQSKARARSMTGDGSISNTGVFTITKSVLYSATGTPQQIIKKIAFSGWNMDTTANYPTVTHDVDDGEDTISMVFIKIFTNAGGSFYSLSDGGYFSVNNQTVAMFRDTGGIFDDALFNNASGEITLIYDV